MYSTTTRLRPPSGTGRDDIPGIWHFTTRAYDDGLLRKTAALHGFVTKAASPGLRRFGCELVSGKCDPYLCGKSDDFPGRGILRAETDLMIASSEVLTPGNTVDFQRSQENIKYCMLAQVFFANGFYGEIPCGGKRRFLRKFWLH
jgi:hypothetical protein